MRERFDDLVEKGRERKGRSASAAGERYGRFLVRHPKSGNLFCFIATDGKYSADFGLDSEWEHVSVSLVALDRLPTWGEMCWVKSLFWGPGEWVVQFHPSESEYVNVHEMVLHLWKPVRQEIPRPPIAAV